MQMVEGGRCLPLSSETHFSAVWEPLITDNVGNESYNLNFVQKLHEG